MLNKIINAIAIKLDQEFGEGYAIHTESVKQGLEEPCFFIVLLTANQTQVVGKRYFREQPFDIHYFPSTNDKNAEIFDIAERLNDAMEYISIDTDLFHGTKMSHETVDEVLHFFVNYNFYVYKEPGAIDPMEILTVGSELKKE